MNWISPAVGVVLLFFAAGCDPAVAEGAPLTDTDTDTDSSASSDGSTSTDATTTGRTTTAGTTATGPDGTTATGPDDSTGSGPVTGDTSSTGDSSSEETGVEPLPEGCEDHLELEVTALSISTDGPTWEPGEAIIVNFSLHNGSDTDNSDYPSVFVGSDTRGVESQMPIFTWFALFAGDTADGDLVFQSTDTLEPGTEVEFTAHVATLDEACPGVGTISTTAIVG